MHIVILIAALALLAVVSRNADAAPFSAPRLEDAPSYVLFRDFLATPTGQLLAASGWKQDDFTLLLGSYVRTGDVPQSVLATGDPVDVLHDIERSVSAMRSAITPSAGTFTSPTSPWPTPTL